MGINGIVNGLLRHMVAAKMFRTASAGGFALGVGPEGLQ